MDDLVPTERVSTELQRVPYYSHILMLSHFGFENVVKVPQQPNTVQLLPFEIPLLEIYFSVHRSRGEIMIDERSRVD